MPIARPSAQPARPTWFRRAAPYLGVSALLLLPCLLPAHIQAGDLASHVYNAWLVQLLRAQQVAGLQIVPQFTNVLFDLLLDAFWQIGGAVFAEKAAVSLSVLVFFWGAFLLASRIARRQIWPLAPFLAMLAFGWLFHRGFFNYYLACGLSFWALALLWENNRRRIAPAALLLALAATAHALPAAAAVSFALYFRLAGRASARHRGLLLAASIAALGLVRLILALRLPTRWQSFQYFNATGADQFLIYGLKYFVLAIIILTVWIALLLRRLDSESVAGFAALPAVHALILCAAAAVILPLGILFPGMQHALLYVDRRISAWAVLFVCGVAGAVPLRRSEAALPALLAAVFFAFMLWDQRILGAVEMRFHEAVQALPRGARAVSAASGAVPAMNPFVHMIDRACIGRCFSYANYEPGSLAFRLRARPGSPVVVDNYADSYALQSGAYAVRPRDLPLFAILPSPGPRLSLDVRALHAGEKVPFLPLPYPPDWF